MGGHHRGLAGGRTVTATSTPLRADDKRFVVLAVYMVLLAILSGASLDRPGIQALLAAAARRPLPFDVLLVDDSSRVSRDLPDAVRFMQQLNFFGVRSLYLSQSIDSASEQAETLVAFRGIIDSSFLKDLAAKVKRGLAGQLERGYATGGTTFGYRTVPIPDPTGKATHGRPAVLGYRVEIDPEAAATVVQIFQWYAEGCGASGIVGRLNRAGVRGPFGRVWRDGAVRRLLANEKYRGLLIWGKKSFVRRPGTKRYVERPHPRSEWRTQERPELRIVSEALWTQVQQRRAAIAALIPPDQQQRRTLMRGRPAAFFSRQLFSGFLFCGTCRHRLLLVSNGRGSPDMAVPRRGAIICVRTG
jgi:DNA invertase Pin-like site-specific DNA recombinase